jgi:wyosine [tRNA(Phe)-imidazoG37] synthetase (radical SAM superfamily)
MIDQNGYEEILQKEIVANFKKIATLISLITNKTYSSTTLIIEIIKNKKLLSFISNYLEISQYSFIEFYSYQYPTASKSKKYKNEKKGNIENVDRECS